MDECYGIGGEGGSYRAEPKRIAPVDMPVTNLAEIRAFLVALQPHEVGEYSTTRATKEISLLTQSSKILLTYIDETAKYVKLVERLNDRLLGSEI